MLCQSPNVHSTFLVRPTIWSLRNDWVLLVDDPCSSSATFEQIDDINGDDVNACTDFKYALLVKHS